MTTSESKRSDLNQSPLYNVTSKRKLFAILKLPSHAALTAILNLENPFRKFEILSKSKLRPIQVPSRQLLPVHARIFSLLKRLELPSYLHSGIKGRSYITNAKAHLNTRTTYTTDLVAFYPSVRRSEVASFFRNTMKCSEDVSAILAKITTCDGHIPTGSAVSQTLAFLTFKKMFDELYSASIKNKVVMTCYVDDLTFSGENVTRAWIFDTIKPIINKYGLKSHKDKFFGPDQPKEITGVIVDGNKIKVCNKLHKSIHLLVLQISGTVDLHQLNKLYDVLIGKLSSAAQIEERLQNRRIRFLKEKRRLIGNRTLQSTFSIKTLHLISPP